MRLAALVLFVTACAAPAGGTTTTPVRGIAEGGGITDEAADFLATWKWGGSHYTKERSAKLLSAETRRGIEHQSDQAREKARDAIVQLLPLLGLQQVPTAMLDREAAIVVLMRAFEEAGERDRKSLDSLGWVGIPPVPGDVLRQHCANVVDLLMPLAQQVPSREEIAVQLDPAAFVLDGYHATSGAKRRREYALEQADVVLALFSKPAGEPQCICHMIVDTYPDPDCPQYSEHVKPAEEGS